MSNTRAAPVGNRYGHFVRTLSSLLESRQHLEVDVSGERNVHRDIWTEPAVTTVRCRTRLRVTTRPGLLFHFTFLVSPQSRLLLRPVHPAPARRGYSGLFPMPSIIYAFLVLSLSRTVSHLPMTGLLRQLLVSDRTRPSCT